MIEASPEPESAEPFGYAFEKFGCRAPDDCVDYLEFVELKDVNADELEKYQKHGRVIALYEHPPKQEQWRPYPRFKPDDCSVDPVVVCLLDDGRIKIGSYADNYDAFIHGGGSVRVTHWMPLPNPPQE
jgi:hypothetical protein